MEPFIGQIILVGFDFAPVGWARCDGTLLQIADHQALFSLLGTTYGGNGTTTFALPDLRGRVPIHQGAGAALTNRALGTRGGVEANQLTAGQLPAHTHALRASTGTPTTHDPQDALLPTGVSRIYAPPGANTVPMGATTTNTGEGQAVNNMPPYQTVNFIIALTGIFPSRT